MSSALTSSLIAVGIVSMICYALMTRLQNRTRRSSSAGANGGGDTGSTYSDGGTGFSLGDWFSGDSSGSSSESGSCSSSDSGGGGDCGGGGDGGGGGGGD